MDTRTTRTVAISAERDHDKDGKRVVVHADFVRDFPADTQRDHGEGELPTPTAADEFVRSTTYPEEAGHRQLSRMRDPYWGEPEPMTGLPADSRPSHYPRNMPRAGEVKGPSVCSVYRHGDTDAVVNVLEPMLQDSDAKVRADAAEGLLRAIEDQPDAVSGETFRELCSAVGRRNSARALLDLVISNPNVVPADCYPDLLLLRRYVSEDRVVAAVSGALSQNPDVFDDAVEYLHAQIGDGQEELDTGVLRILATVAPDLVTDELENRPFDVLLSIDVPALQARAIQEIEPSFWFPEKDLASELRECLQNENGLVRNAAVDRLHRLYDDYRYSSDLPALTADLRPLLSDPSRDTRVSATRFILNHGDIRPGNVELLVDTADTLLTDDVQEIRILGADVLQAVVRVDPWKALPALERLHRIALDPEENTELQSAASEIVATLRDELANRQLTLEYPYHLHGIEFATWKATVVSVLRDLDRE